MRVSLYSLGLLTLSALFAFGCDPRPECQGAHVSYTQCIRPALTANCSGGGCHGGDKPAKNLNLEKIGQIYDGIFKKAISVNGKTYLMIAPNEPDKSYLYIKLKPNPPAGGQMPIGLRPLLSASQLKMFETWIREGAKNDDPNYKPDLPAKKPTIPAGIKNVSYSNAIKPLLNQSCGISDCHDSATQSGGLALDGDPYDKILGKKSLNGAYELVKAGQPLESLLLVKLLEQRPRKAGTRMPPEGSPPLTTEQIAQIYVWIEEGAKKDKPTKP